MKDEKLHISPTDPELPDFLKDARRNHYGMTVPEDFFAQFEKKMNDVIDAEVARTEAAEPVIGRKELPKPSILIPRRWVGIAAVVAIIAAVSLTLQLDFSNDVNTQTPQDGIPTISASSMQSEEDIYLPEQVADELMASASDYDIFELYCDI